MSELTPQETAERLRLISHDILQHGDTVVESDEMEYLDYAVSILRKVSIGELMPVVKCKECIFFEVLNTGVCKCPQTCKIEFPQRDPDDSCGFGQRKRKEQEEHCE